MEDSMAEEMEAEVVVIKEDNHRTKIATNKITTKDLTRSHQSLKMNVVPHRNSLRMELVEVLD
jgi:hypothetical protein